MYIDDRAYMQAAEDDDEKIQRERERERVQYLVRIIEREMVHFGTGESYQIWGDARVSLPALREWGSSAAATRVMHWSGT